MLTHPRRHLDNREGRWSAQGAPQRSRAAVGGAPERKTGGAGGRRISWRQWRRRDLRTWRRTSSRDDALGAGTGGIGACYKRGGRCGPGRTISWGRIAISLGMSLSDTLGTTQKIAWCWVACPSPPCRSTSITSGDEKNYPCNHHRSQQMRTKSSRPYEGPFLNRGRGRHEKTSGYQQEREDSSTREYLRARIRQRARP